MSGAAPASIGIKPVLITGGAGFIGSNLADRLARDGENVLIFDALAREGVARNLDWLRRNHPARIAFVQADIRDADAIAAAAREASAVFHLAAQVAVTTSLVDPLEDFSINVTGTVQLLEALRRRDGSVPLVFASTNKVYGDLADILLVRSNDAYLPQDARVAGRGISEQRPLDFHTPYGCSKGAADQYVLDYARSFGVPAAVMRMSCIYGPRQMGTEDQGWVAHFIIRALSGEPISVFGDGFQVRDLLYVEDAVEAYVGARRRMDVAKGRVYNLGGGPANAVSLVQLLAFLEERLGRPVETVFHDWREGDQRYYVSDTRRVRQDLELPAPTPWRAGVGKLVDWLSQERAPAVAPLTSERRVAGARA